MNLKKHHPLYQEDLNQIRSIKGIEQLRGKSFLITGATGMIGVMLIDALMEIPDISIYAVGRSRKKAESRLGEYFENPRFYFIEQDVCEPFNTDLNVDYIIPAASNTHPLAYSSYPIETIMINVKGVEHALALAENSGATVIYPSTIEIYGNAINGESFAEEDNGRLSLSNARSCYTESKRLSEALCQSFIAERGVKVKIVRLCRIFGPTMLEEDSKASSQFIRKAILGEDIVLKSNGNQFFSYIYVADAVIGILEVLLHGQIGEAYNVSSDKTNIHLRDFAQICAELTRKEVVFELPSEIERNGYSIAMQAVLSNKKIKDIGYRPIYEMRDAILRTYTILK